MTTNSHPTGINQERSAGQAWPPGSSGGWGRASGLLLFRETLLPPELHRNRTEILVGIEPTSCGVADRRLASGPQDQERAGGGARTHFVRVTKAVPVPSGIAGIKSSQCWCRASSAGVQSPGPLRGPGQQREGGRRESNPHNPGSQPGPATALGSATVLQPGFEPGTQPSQSRVMSLSPSKQQLTVPRPGVEPGPAL